MTVQSPQVIDTARKELMAAGLADPVLFLRTFLPHWFGKKIPWAHRGMIAIILRQSDFLLNFGPETWPEEQAVWTRRDLDKIIKHFVWKEHPKAKPVPLFTLHEFEDGSLRLDLAVAKNTQVVWPRGFGKTTTINGCQIYKIAYKLKKFMVYLSETATHADQQIENIKRELTSNAALIAVFGVFKPDRADEESWRNGFFQTKTGITVMAKGRGGQVRGTLVGDSRPDDFIIDDVEDKESVRTPEQREKTLTWLYADVLPAENQIKKNATFTMVGTLLHREAMIPKVMGDPDWVSIVFGAIDPDGEPLWPEYMTLEQIEKKKRSFIRVGKLAEFYMEFLSELRNVEGAKFPGPFTIIPRVRSDFVAVALALDPAIGEKRTADYCSFAVTGMTEQGIHHVLDMHMEKAMSPRAIINKFFDLVMLWDPTHKGIESVAFQKALVHLVKEEQFRKARVLGPKAYFEVIPIPNGQNKFLRVEGVLQPRYAAGYITHQRTFPELEEQLLDWPAAKLDGPDSVAMAITLLDPYAGTTYDNGDPNEDGIIEDKLAKDMYEELDEEYFRSAV